MKRFSACYLRLASLFIVFFGSASAQTSQFVYISGTPYGGTSEDLIRGFSINGASGALTAIPTSPYSAGGAVQEMVAHPSGDFVYAATTAGIAAFSVDALTGGLTPVSGSPFGTAPSSGYPDGGPAYPLLAMDPSGKFLFVANESSGQIQEFSVDATSGALSLQSQVSVPGVNALIEGPLGGYVYAYATGGTAVYSINPTSGTLTLVQTASSCGGGKMAIDSSGSFLYGLAGGISACQINTSSGSLTPVSGSPFAISVGIDNLTAHPSGPYLYAVASGSVSQNPANMVYGYTIDAATGALTAMQNSPFPLANENGNYTYVFGIAVEPRGKYAYVTESNYGVASYSINQSTGELSLISTSFQGSNADMVVTVGSQALWSPGLNWSAQSAITYGTALSSTQLNASSPIAGTFNYSPTAGTVLSVGLQTLTVTFTPADTSDYTSATAQVTLTVNQATPTITWATPAAITYGTALSATQLDATASVPGSFSYSYPAGTVLTGGTHSITATFTPSDSANYKTATYTIYQTVSQLTPTITWATPATITYGTALGGTQFNATASVPGTFYYSTPLGSILTAGSHIITASFYPSDSTDYSYTTANVTLMVNKATPTITWTAPPGVTYGTALSSTQLNAKATGSGVFAATPVNGNFVYSPNSGTVLGVGPQTLTALFSPIDTNDYTTAAAAVTLTVNQASPTITWPAPASIFYGTALSTAQLNASATVPGTFIYTPALGATPPIGNDTLTVIFTPTDNIDYATASATVTLTVSPLPNPVPFIGNMTPAIADAGGTGFTITVNGSGFLANSTVYWGTTALPTQFVSASQLTATVSAADIASAGAWAINVQNPSPGGGRSDVLQFEVDSSSGAATAPTVSSTAVTLNAGSTATYSISFPQAVTNATATCLNLPAGAVCSYSSANRVLTITTSSTTPAGTYQITVVFTETVSTTASASILLPFLLLPLFFLRSKLSSRGIWSAGLGLILLIASLVSSGCGGSSSSSSPPLTTNQTVTSSSIVDLIVQ